MHSQSADFAPGSPSAPASDQQGHLTDVIFPLMLYQTAAISVSPAVFRRRVTGYCTTPEPTDEEAAQLAAAAMAEDTSSVGSLEREVGCLSERMIHGNK